MMTVYSILGALLVWLLVDCILQSTFSPERKFNLRDFALLLAGYAIVFALVLLFKIGAAGTIGLVSFLYLLWLVLLLVRADGSTRLLYVACLAGAAFTILGIHVFQSETEIALRNTPWAALVWSGSDQLFYAMESVNLLEGTTKGIQYAPGYSFFLLPNAGLLRVSAPDLGVAFANHLNLSLLGFHLVILLPASFMLASRAVLTLLEHDQHKWKPVVRPDHAESNNLEPDHVSKRHDQALGTTSRARWFGYLGVPLVLALLFVLYVVQTPGWMADRNAILGSRRLVGLVFGPEILSLLIFTFFTAIAVQGAALTKHRAILLGALAGFAIIVSERNVAFAGPIFLVAMLNTRPRNLKNIVATMACFGASAAVLLSAYPLYTKLVFGQFFMSTRNLYWEGAKRGDFWLKMLPDLYPSLKLDTAPRMSLHYLPDNFARLMEGYGPAMIVFALALLVPWFRWPWNSPSREGRIGLAVLLSGTAFITLLIGVTYVNPMVTFRYYGILIPAFVIAVFAALTDLKRETAMG
ncbi:hypothetical protein AB4072_13315 [Microvirga sp. 2MCAF38]|uniref:hypothetical protein n=1 Tax=Microvirga sp. 2MCAF38 TaxID=3232989 RepID=UPI003F99F421